MRELFVYYRIRSADTALAQTAVATLQTRLRQQFPQLKTRLLCRSESSGEDPTWMEIYAMEPLQGAAGVTAEIQHTIDALAGTLVQPYIVGTRHAEVFEPCATSA